MTAEKCGHSGCDNIGTMHPVLLARPEGQPDFPHPAELWIGFVVCPEHQVNVVPEDFVSDEGWLTITRTFQALGKAAPDRSTLGLRWGSPAEYKASGTSGVAQARVPYKRRRKVH